MRYKNLSLSILLIMALEAGAQQIHFIFIRTENRDPFYVSLNKKNHSSSPAGYVVLSKLENGKYPIRIGFPNTGIASEQDYVIPVKDQDQGFILKSFGEKGWGLFNMSTLEIQYSGEARKQEEALAAAQKAAEKRAADSLAAIEAEAIARQAAERQRADSIAEVANKQRLAEKKRSDSIAIAKALLEEQQEAAAKAAAEAEKRTVDSKANKVDPPAAPLVIMNKDTVKAKAHQPMLLDQRDTDSGRIYHYAVYNGNTWDTVQAFIKTKDAPPPAPTLVDTVAKQVEPAPVVKEPKRTDVKFLDIDLKQDTATTATADHAAPTTQGTAKQADTVTSIDTTTAIKPVVKEATRPNTDSITDKIPNSNCRAEANEKDFFSLRKKMAAEEGVDEMILVAKKVMKEKCFTTAQIRNLSVLFLTDADRYQFLDAAYPFTSDAYDYASLVDLLKDRYYIERFKVMVRK